MEANRTRNEIYSITVITNLKTSAKNRHCEQPWTLAAIFIKHQGYATV
jgi:hypothetical protein